MGIHISTILLTTNNAATEPQAEVVGSNDVKRLLMHNMCWLLLCCYTLMLLKPAVPAFADMLAHTFWQQQHLMTVHEEHGSFHVHYEQQKNTENKGKPVSSYKYEIAEHINTGKIDIAIDLRPTAYTPVYGGYIRYYPVLYGDMDEIPPQNA